VFYHETCPSLLHFPKGKCHKSPVFCRFRRREMEFPSAHRRLRLRNYVYLWISMDNICFSQLCASMDYICFFQLTMGKLRISISKNIYPTTLFLNFLYFCMKLSMDLWHFYCWKRSLPHIMSWIGMFYKPLLTVKSILCCNLWIIKGYQSHI
jgi:hypothetical protein